MKRKMVHGRAEKGSGVAVDSDHSGPGKAKKGTTVGRASSFIVTILLVGLLVTVISTKGRNNESLELMASEVSQKQIRTNEKTNQSNNNGPPPPMYDLPNLDSVTSKYENCQVQWTPPPPKSEWTTKPLWLPASPGSGSNSPNGKGDIFKPLIQGITGMDHGVKFYHASSKTLKRCKGVDETVACSNSHPVVDINPDSRSEDFHDKYILILRNMATMFHTNFNEKQEAYHNAKGQTPVEDWRKFRDQWYKGVPEGYVSLIRTWKNLQHYDVGTYVQYEEMMDPKRGPQAMTRLANLLQASGFDVAPQEDLSCIWYQTIKPEYDRLKEYKQYTYGYTQEQVDFFVEGLTKFQEEETIKDDKALASILQEYIHAIQENTYIDIPHQE